MKAKANPIEKQLTKLLEDGRNDAGDILQVLLKLEIEKDKTRTTDERLYGGSLIDEMILQLTCNGYNIIKASTLSEQIAIEESIKRIYPYLTQAEKQYNLAY